MTTRQRRWQMARIAAGLCGICGNPRGALTTMCDDCAEKQNTRRRRPGGQPSGAGRRGRPRKDRNPMVTNPLKPGDRLYRVLDKNHGTFDFAIASVEIVRLTPQFAVFRAQHSNLAFGFRTRLTLAEAHAEARTPQEAAARFVKLQRDALLRQQKKLAAAVEFMDQVAHNVPVETA